MWYNAGVAPADEPAAAAAAAAAPPAAAAAAAQEAMRDQMQHVQWVGPYLNMWSSLLRIQNLNVTTKKRTKSCAKPLFV